MANFGELYLCSILFWCLGHWRWNVSNFMFLDNCFYLHANRLLCFLITTNRSRRFFWARSIELEKTVRMVCCTPSLNRCASELIDSEAIYWTSFYDFDGEESHFALSFRALSRCVSGDETRRNSSVIIYIFCPFKAWIVQHNNWVTIYEIFMKIM